MRAVQTPAELRALRLGAGLTQRQAAALVYVGHRTWCSWEQGRTPISQTAVALFQILTEPCGCGKSPHGAGD